MFFSEEVCVFGDINSIVFCCPWPLGAQSGRIWDKIVDFCIPEIPESRRQDLKPEAYVRSGSIYAMSRRFVMEEKRYYSGKSFAYILPAERTINIDDKDNPISAANIIKQLCAAV